MLERGAVFLTFLLAAFSTPAISADPNPGIVGSDDRVITSDARFTAVGRLNLSGKGFCTATLISPQVVMTAAHCTYYRRTGKPIPPDRIHFGAGWRKGKPLAHRIAKHVRRHPNYDSSKSTASDIALIVLESPIIHKDIKPIPIDRQQGRVRVVVPLTHVSYSKDTPHLPSIERGCVVRAEEGRILYTDCDSSFGGSGAPILRQTDQGFAVLGVVSGVIKRDGLKSPIASAGTFGRRRVLGSSGLNGYSANVFRGRG